MSGTEQCIRRLPPTPLLVLDTHRDASTQGLGGVKSVSIRRVLLLSTYLAVSHAWQRYPSIRIYAALHAIRGCVACCGGLARDSRHHGLGRRAFSETAQGNIVTLVVKYEPPVHVVVERERQEARNTRQFSGCCGLRARTTKNRATGQCHPPHYYLQQVRNTTSARTKSHYCKPFSTPRFDRCICSY